MELAGDGRTQALRGSDLALLLLGAGQHAVSQLSTSPDTHLMDSLLTISRISESRLLAADINPCVLPWVMTVMRTAGGGGGGGRGAEAGAAGRRAGRGEGVVSARAGEGAAGRPARSP